MTNKKRDLLPHDHIEQAHEQAKPKQDLEELYQGIPDESVNLTFQDLANVNSSNNINSTTATIEHASLVQLATPQRYHHLLFPQCLVLTSERDWRHPITTITTMTTTTIIIKILAIEAVTHHGVVLAMQVVVHMKNGEYSMSYGAMKNGESLASGKGLDAWQCVEIGMGEMTEGRKCIECLGLRFSQRYMERAGMVGFCSWRYPSTLKHAELKWAEKGPRKSGDRGYGHHSMASSRPRTPTTPRSPLSIAITEPSFVMSATHSPFSAHHHLPL
ncbi:hypothetical protein E2542_SST29317 [Spatholobus suberectus]|nr:hypothetical protein E2542_SST29317 [Spatholobus suberectus]